MRERRDMAASVKQRLLNLAQARGEAFNLLLTRYGSERLLYRLARSGHQGEFVLKGAMLFHLWSETLHRPTKDVDLLGHGSPDPARLLDVFRVCCATPVEDDGLAFPVESVRAERLRAGEEYEGVRITLECRLGSARIPLQVDVGFGDASLPSPEMTDFPVLLDQPAPRLRVYRRETVVAEKLHAMVDLGMANSRMKDFYDLRFLSATFAFEGVELGVAIGATFTRRRTPLPDDIPTALTDGFAKDPAKEAQWKAFLRRSRLEVEQLSLSTVVAGLRGFLLPPLGALAAGEGFELIWRPGGPWQRPEEGTES